MRPATTPINSPKPRVAVWIVAAALLVLVARAAGERVVDDRCIAAAKAMRAGGLTGTDDVGRELDRLAPSERWSIGPRGRNGAREVAYDGWRWSCRDDESLPTLVAVSNAARELTPERSFEPESAR